ncbi:MAG: hypothetical protein DCC75_10340 [Proteobacteria bacterium]|nr:MAG: hypothetical protein DCC75_10340 [Pseudomonadota bacterium]
MLKAVDRGSLDPLIRPEELRIQGPICRILGFDFDSFTLQRHSQRFGFEIDSALSEGQLREIFARELIPIEPAGLELISEGRFNVEYSERVSLFAGSFFVHLYLDSITGGRYGNVGGILDHMVKTEQDPRVARFANICRYYWDVDMRRLDNVLSLLEGAAYERANQLFPSPHDVAEFFAKGRKVQLVHGITQVLACGKMQLVWGDFTGYGEDNTARSGQFADVWEFLEDRSKPFFRQSYLRTPQVLAQVRDYPLEGPGFDQEVNFAVTVASRLALRFSELKPTHLADRKFHSIEQPLELGERLQMTELHARQNCAVFRGLWRSEDHNRPVPVFHLLEFSPDLSQVISSRGYFGLGAGYVQK